jgi:regulatory protein
MARRPERPIDPYQYALTALSRRELTAAQLRRRLAQRDVPHEAIDAVIERLRTAGHLDDRRAGLLLARTAVHVKRRGRARVLREVEAFGLDRDTARDVADEVFRDVDEQELVERALASRLRGPIADRRDFERLYRYLVRQGFSSDQILRALRAKGRPQDPSL